MSKQKKLMEKLDHLLRDHFKGSDVILDHSQKRIFGTLIWKGFKGHEQIERQEELWDFLLKELLDDEQTQIAAIFTAIPEEVSHA